MAQENEPVVLANYVNGEFQAPANGEYFDDLNPATAEVIAKVPRSTSVDVNAAVAAAKAAEDGPWGDTTPAERADWLDKIADKIQERFEQLALLESRDTGKPLALARAVDIPRAISNFRFFAGSVRHSTTTSSDMGHAINYTHRSPVGVAGLITPWNLPLYLLSWKVAPALACGNTIVAKPSEVTPLTAFALAEIIHDVGLPVGVFNLVNGMGAVTGGALVAHKDVDLVSFTGGTVTGRKVGEVANQTFKKLSLELGGKNATVVFDDCDFDAAVEGAAKASFANQGQICLCGSRLFVQEGIYDKFMAAFLEKVAKLQPGDPSTSNFGSLTSHMHRDKVESYIELAKKNGGKILCGGKRPDLPAPFDKGAFLEPTVVADLPYTDRCAQEEIFGPMITVHKFATEKEALTAVNSTKYGLAGSLWTSNLKRAHKFTQKWKTGMVWVNTWLLRDLRVPFGGVKASGIGREGGDYSLEFYSHDKNICIKL